MKEKVNQVRIVDVFEKCWRELLKEYGENRLFNVYCSEADLQLHLASKLLKELRPPVCVYVEFPIPFEIDDFVFQRLRLWSIFGSFWMFRIFVNFRVLKEFRNVLLNFGA